MLGAILSFPVTSHYFPACILSYREAFRAVLQIRPDCAAPDLRTCLVHRVWIQETLADLSRTSPPQFSHMHRRGAMPPAARPPTTLLGRDEVGPTQVPIRPPASSVHMFQNIRPLFPVNSELPVGASPCATTRTSWRRCSIPPRCLRHHPPARRARCRPFPNPVPIWRSPPAPPSPRSPAAPFPKRRPLGALPLPLGALVVAPFPIPRPLPRHHPLAPAFLPLRADVPAGVMRPHRWQ